GVFVKLAVTGSGSPSLVQVPFQPPARSAAAAGKAAQRHAAMRRRWIMGIPCSLVRPPVATARAGPYERDAEGESMRAALLAVWAVILTTGIVQAANGLQTDIL